MMFLASDVSALQETSFGAFGQLTEEYAWKLAGKSTDLVVVVRFLFFFWRILLSFHLTITVLWKALFLIGSSTSMSTDCGVTVSIGFFLYRGTII